MCIGAPRLPDDAIWILENDSGQGTGFLLDGVGLITCDHVLDDGLTFAFRPEIPAERHQLAVERRDRDCDLAVCSLPALPRPMPSLTRTGRTIGVGTAVRVVGYPNWNPGNSMHDAHGAITSVRRYFAARYLVVSAGIYAGCSGAPVLGIDGRVLGVARAGPRVPGDREGDQFFGVVDISCLWRGEGVG
jgi:S1-C subfamily serine protease